MRKVQKRLTNQKVDNSEIQSFLLKRIGLVANAEQIRPICYFDWTQKPSFGRLVLEESQKIFKKKGQTIKVLTFQRGNILALGRFGRSCIKNEVLPTRFLNWSENLRYGRVVFEKNQKIFKTLKQIKKLTFFKTITFSVRNIVSDNYCRRVSHHPFFSLNPQTSEMRNKFSRKNKKIYDMIKNLNFDYSEDHNFMCKKIGWRCLCRVFFIIVLLLNPKVRSQRGSFRENEKKSKYGTNISERLFRRL